MPEALCRNVDQMLALAESSARSTDEVLVNSAFVARMVALRKKSPQEEQHLIRQLASQLLEANGRRIESTPYPASVHQLMHQEFDRIAKAVAEEPDDYFRVSSHGCRCDLRILSFGRIPVGPEHLEIDGLPRSVIWKQGLSQAARVLSIAMKTHGFKPFYVTHLAYGFDPATFLFQYSRRAQKKMFLTIADCLRMHPQIKGVLAGSWWHDPQLDRVAPHLTYLRTGWTDHGAELLFWEASPDIDDVATRNSPARRELFEQGQYHPKAYMAVWPRKALLSWADKENKE